MKGIILTSLFVMMLVVGQANNMHCHAGRSQRMQNGATAVPVQCTGLTGGTLTYHVDGLPVGATFEDRTVIVPSNIAAGQYQLKITVTDAFGHSTYEYITLNVIQAQAQQQTGSQANGQTSTTSSQSSSTTSTSNAAGSTTDGRLNEILSTFSTVTEYNINYEGNTFPTTQFPTGTTGQNINTEIITINNAQAPVSSDNRNTITADNVQLRAASERYQNAVKGVTNLLTIIDQARANKAKAQNDLTVYTNRYNDALRAQRAAQENIINIEVRITQIRSAVAGAQDKLDDVNDRIAEIQNSINNLNNRKTQLNTQIETDRANRNGLVEQLAQVNQDLADLIEQLEQARMDADKVRIQLEKTIEQLNQKRQELDTLQQRRRQAENDLRNKQAEVERLTALLEQAKAAEADARIVLEGIIASENVLPGQIADLEARIASLQVEYDRFLAIIADLEARIADLQTGDIVDLQNQIDALGDRIRINTNAVRDIDAQIAEHQAELQDLLDQQGDLEDTLTFLNSQLVSVQTQLRAAYNAGNDANNQVAIARQNLVAVNARWERECEIQSEATLNLERARAEAELAKLALDELIAHYSDALPYSIVPNGNGVGAGTPYGNNAAGAALGPATQGSGRIEIDNWTQYLSSAFGRGINPALDENVNYLYTFQPATQNGLRTQDNTCDGNGPVRSIVGYIMQVGDNSMMVNSNGHNMQLNFGTCTNFASNQQNAQLTEGNQIIARGHQENGALACTDAVMLY